MILNLERSNASVRLLTVFVAALLLAVMMVISRPSTTFASTPCSVFALTPTTTGVTASGISRIDCPASPVSDWVKGEIVSLFFFIPTTQDTCINNDNNSSLHGCTSTYNCNGSGTLEHFTKVNGRDAAGGESGWRESSHVSLTC